MDTKKILSKLHSDFSGHTFEMSGDGLLKVDGEVAYIKWETDTTTYLSEAIKASADAALYDAIKKEVEVFLKKIKKTH